jgi:hypothetical protein
MLMGTQPKPQGADCGIKSETVVGCVPCIPATNHAFGLTGNLVRESVASSIHGRRPLGVDLSRWYVRG